MKSVVQRIRIYRNMTQTQLAEKSHVSIVTIRLIENGKHVRLTHFCKLANALDFPVKRLLPEE